MLSMFLIVLLFIALAVVFTRPLASKSATHAQGEAPGDPAFQAWTIAWDVHMLGENPFNLFNANIFYPGRYTLAYADHQFTNAILAIPLLTTAGNPILAENLLKVFHFFLCSLGAYLLVAHLTKNRPAGVVAGIAFAYAPQRFVNIGQLHMCSAGWIPLTLLFLHRYSEGKKGSDAALAGLFFTLAALSTWYYAVMLAVAVALFLVVRFFTNRSTYSLEWLFKLALVFAIAFLIIYPFARPYLKLGKEEPGFGWKLEYAEQSSADVQDFLVTSSSTALWGRIGGGLRADSIRRGGGLLFPGLLPLVLGIGGAVYLYRRRKDRPEERFYLWFYLALFILGVVLCLGPFLHAFGRSSRFGLPYSWFYYLFPGFKALRVPTRFAVYTSLSLAVFSGFAVAGICKWVASRKGVFLSVLLSIAIVLILLADLMTTPIPVYKVPGKDGFPKAYSWLQENGGSGPIVELPVDADAPGARREIDRIYYSTAHWMKMVNGYSGFTPRSWYYTAELSKEFPSLRSIGQFKEWGVKNVILHGDEIDSRELRDMIGRSKEYQGLKLLKRIDSDYVFELLTSPPGQPAACKRICSMVG